MKSTFELYLVRFLFLLGIILGLTFMFAGFKEKIVLSGAAITCSSILALAITYISRNQ